MNALSSIIELIKVALNWFGLYQARKDGATSERSKSDEEFIRRVDIGARAASRELPSVELDPNNRARKK
jgi:hypothetical protein